MITQIGIVAGEIWSFLDEHGEVNLKQIMKELDKPEQLILMSVGWLARENHILVKKKNNTYHISLNRKTEKIKNKVQ